MAEENELEMEQVRAVKSKYQDLLMQKRNVVGVGIGLREVGGQITEQIALTVMVRKKYPFSQLHPHDVIPSELDGVPVDVKEVGVFRI